MSCVPNHINEDTDFFQVVGKYFKNVNDLYFSKYDMYD